MTVKGCHQCKYNNSELVFPLSSGEMKRTCLKGNTELLKQWWADNGHNRSEDCYSLPCCEYTDLTKDLIRLNESASDILNDIKKINNNK